MRHQGRTSIKGKHSQACKFKKRQYSYGFKNAVLVHFAQHADVSLAVDEFFEDKTPAGVVAASKLISKWKKNAVLVATKAASSRTSSHSRHRPSGLATALSPAAELQIVEWINELRADGVPVSSKMLELKAIEIAEESGIPSGYFTASNPWKESFLSRHRLSFRAKNRAGQTSPDVDNIEALSFAALVLGWMQEHNVHKLFNADQTSVQFEMLPKRTVSARGVQTAWIKCGKKEKQRATVMLLADSDGNKYAAFFVFKSHRSTIPEVQKENDGTRHGFGKVMWREIRELQDVYGVQIYGNETAWWNESIMIAWMKYFFGDRNPRSEPVMLLLDSFSGHWTADVKAFAKTVNVILKQVPPKMTWRCQPADVAWIKPMKDGLRRRWVEHLRRQLEQHKRMQQRLREQEALRRQEALARQEPPAPEQQAPRFVMTPPDRGDVVEWVTEEWFNLSERTIKSGFSKCGFTAPGHADTAALADRDAEDEDVTELVTEL